MYKDFMEETLRLNHMELVRNFEVRRYYIQCLPVLRPDRSTTKFRVVFNTLAKNKTRISLNEALMTGPTLKLDLFEILTKFRIYLIAFSADISKMYRQVSVHPNGQPLQSILWRHDSNLPIQVYQLTTLTYSTAPASYIVTKCSQMIAKEAQSVQPDVSLAILSQFYMDDLLTGAETVEEAVSKCRSIQTNLDRASFHL